MVVAHPPSVRRQTVLRMAVDGVRGATFIVLPSLAVAGAERGRTDLPLLLTMGVIGEAVNLQDADDLVH